MYNNPLINPSSRIAITADDPEMIAALQNGFESRDLIDLYGLKFVATKLAVNPGATPFGALHAEEVRMLDPLPWAGVGLPPVGAECEYQRNDVCYKQAWVAVTPLYIGDSITVLRHSASGNEFTEMTASCVFQPISTEAQLAADRRSESIKRAAELCAFPKADHTFVILEALYDNGLLKGDEQ